MQVLRDFTGFLEQRVARKLDQVEQTLIVPKIDGFHLRAQRATDEQGDRFHRTVSISGTCSTDTKESLKSERPESSTYSTLSGSSKATCLSRKDSSAILAPSPAVLPTERMRSTSTAGTSPIIFALSGFRYEPNEPPSKTSSRSVALTPITSMSTLI